MSGKARSTQEQLEFLHGNVRVKGDCHIWAGGCSSARYPFVRWRKKQWRAQALQHFLLTGDRVNTRTHGVVLSCGDQRCMNPEHCRVVPRGRVRARTEAQMVSYLKENVRRVVGSDCLLWAGPFYKTGLPLASWKGSTGSARRLLYNLTRRNPADVLTGTMRVHATCGERTCMNPKHFAVLSQADLVRHTASRGRFPNGRLRSIKSFAAHAARARLPVTERDNVRDMVLQGASLSRVAERYGVHKSAVSSAIRRWRAAELINW